MSIDSDYALLAAASYNDIRRLPLNRVSLPQSWVELTQFEVTGSGANASLLSSGLSAKVFKNTSTGEVVISYAGTEFDATTGAFVDFAFGNIPAFIGLTSPQAVAAAELYQLVSTSASLAGANITFTGHSLGGGLAAMMGVLFDKPAVVFAPAPFGASLTGSPLPTAISVAHLIRSKLALNAFATPSLQGVPEALQEYSLAIYNTRLANVRSYAVTGEFLDLIPIGRIELAGARTHLIQAPNDLASKHSHNIDLHAAALLSPDFELKVGLRPSSLKVMFDEKLYGYGPLSDKPDFLIQLVNHQVTQERSGTPESGLLQRFSTELVAIGAQSETSASKATLDTVLALTVEWYYWAGARASSDQKYLNVSDGVLQFTPLSSTQTPSLEGSRALAYSARWELFDADDHADHEALWMKMGSPTKASEPSRNAGARA
jgi:Lipase (class 3)